MLKFIHKHHWKFLLVSAFYSAGTGEMFNAAIWASVGVLIFMRRAR